MIVVIVLRKDVADIAAAKLLVNTIKTKIAEYPEVTINASISDQVIPD